MAKLGLKTAFGAAILLATVGCSTPQRTLGHDPSTQTNASQVTWTDGKPAYAVSCQDPAACQTRVLILCRDRDYTTLRSQNMPSIGTYREELGPPSVVVRCS